MLAYAVKRGNNVLYMCALLGAVILAAGPDWPPDPLSVSVARDQPDVPVYAGEPVALRITLHNAAPGPMMLPDWEHFPVIDVRAKIADYPGARGEGQDTPGEWKGGPFQKSDFRPLAPGETAVVRAVTPLLPGKMQVTVTVLSEGNSYQSLADGKTVKVDNAWTGRVVAHLAVDVPATLSPAAKARYDAVREQLADPLAPAEQKGRLLVKVAAEKHYFAARFLRETTEGMKPGPMRDAAIGCLTDLAKFGAGYEAVPLLVQALNDPNVAQLTRENLLVWVADALAAKGRVHIDDQAWYVWPEALRQSAREAVEQMTKDRNPYLGAKAKEALRRLAAAETAAPAK